mmetsp:Transcript_11854/g.16558  ORF Transcript_11854/g.16558 Transcript_11854/m.16558 type:complete len:371 (-) Transcript_11854:65-1177(-)
MYRSWLTLATSTVILGYSIRPRCQQLVRNVQGYHPLALRSSSLPKLQPALSRRALYCRASKGDDKDGRGNQPKDEEDKKKTNMDQMKKTLERAGYDSLLAKAKLEEWKSMGLNSSKDVRDHLVSGAVQSLGIKVGWLTFYATITWLFYQWSQASGEGGLGQLFLLLFTYLNAYSFIQEFILFGTLAYATIQFASNPVLLDAIQEIAGVSPEIPALNVKPQKVVDVLRVFSSLQELNVRLKSKNIEPSPLDALGSMLTLSQSAGIEEYCDVDDKEACIADLDTAAKIFNRYDLNGDQRLEQEEVRLMLSDVGLNLEEDEVEEAIRILDSLNQDGYVQFDEFVTFWQNKLEEPIVELSPDTDENVTKDKLET